MEKAKREQKPTQHKGSYGLSFFLGCVVVALVYRVVTGQFPGARQGLVLGPIVAIFVAPLIDAIIRSKSTATSEMDV